MAEPTRYYWDACAWIAYIKKEMPADDPRIKEPRFEMCRRVLEQAQSREIEIVTSAFTLSEVCKNKSDPFGPGINLPAFFEQPYILLVSVDKQIGMKAQQLQLAGVSGLKPADATHIASALVWDIPIFHTFDGKLLDLDKSLSLTNGTQLRIMHPTSEDPQGGLFTEPHNA